MRKTQQLLFYMIGAVVLAAPSVASALEIAPGEWRTTETAVVNGKAGQPDVSTDCVSAEEPRDPMKALAEMQQKDQQCSRADVKQNGNSVTFVMQCGDAKQGTMDMAMTFTFDGPRHYTGVFKSAMSFGGQKMTTDGTVDARWIGACKK
jgi:hypothetical protein